MPLKELEGHTTRVLMVDPEEPSASAVAESFANSDRYEVCAAANEFEAGMLAGNFEPHVIFVNVVTPTVNAKQILKNLRANPNLAATKVVAIAGSPTSAQSRALLREGFDMVLPKPYNADDILRVVEEATDLTA